jgi:hypothetical protein
MLKPAGELRVGDVWMERRQGRAVRIPRIYRDRYRAGSG